MNSAVVTVATGRVAGGDASHADDLLAVEEALEIRLGNRNLTITMRTPGNDFELAAGFLHSEGMIQNISQIRSMGRPKRWQRRSRGGGVGRRATGGCAGAAELHDDVRVRRVRKGVVAGSGSEYLPQSASGRHPTLAGNHPWAAGRSSARSKYLREHRRTARRGAFRSPREIGVPVRGCRAAQCLGQTGGRSAIGPANADVQQNDLLRCVERLTLHSRQGYVLNPIDLFLNRLDLLLGGSRNTCHGSGQIPGFGTQRQCDAKHGDCSGNVQYCCSHGGSLSLESSASRLPAPRRRFLRRFGPRFKEA